MVEEWKRKLICETTVCKINIAQLILGSEMELGVKFTTKIDARIPVCSLCRLLIHKTWLGILEASFFELLNYHIYSFGKQFQFVSLCLDFMMRKTGEVEGILFLFLYLIRSMMCLCKQLQIPRKNWKETGFVAGLVCCL